MQRRHTLIFVLAIFCIAFAIRSTLIWVQKSYTSIERSEMSLVALALAEKHQFADAYGPNSGPTAHVAPLYPILLSRIFVLFGTGTRGEIVQELFSSALASAGYGLLPLLAIALEFDVKVGLLAGFTGALLPINFWSETKGSWECAATGLTLELVCLFVALTWRGEQFRVRRAIGAGFLFGLAALISPGILAPTLAMSAVGVWLFRSRIASYLRFIAIAAVITFLVMSPWAIRNRLVLGKLIFTRSNLGLELATSDNDQAGPSLDDLNTAQGLYHPFSSTAARILYEQLGEVAFNEYCMRQAKSWIESHPAEFLRLTAERFVLFWFPRMKRWPQTALIRLEALAGIIGFVLLLRRRTYAAGLFLALWLTYPLIYYFVGASARYRYPIDWSLLFLAAFALFTLFNSLMKSSRPAEGSSLPFRFPFR